MPQRDSDGRSGARRTRRTLSLGIALVAFAGVVSLWLFDLVPGPAEATTALRDAGPAGALLYVAAFTVLQPWGLPGSLFVVPASLVWPPAVAFGLSWIGANLAAAVAFLFARWAGRDWARGRLGPRFRAYEQRLEEHALATVVTLRLLFVSAPPASWLLGISGVSLRTCLLGSAIGFVPGVALITLIGNRGLAASQDRSATSLLLLGLVVAAFVLYQHRARRADRNAILVAVATSNKEGST